MRGRDTRAGPWANGAPAAGDGLGRALEILLSGKQVSETFSAPQALLPVTWHPRGTSSWHEGAGKLVARTRDGEFRYTFADPHKCHCLYVGGPKEYASYQRLAQREEVAEFASGAGSIRWRLWGP